MEQAVRAQIRMEEIFAIAIQAAFGMVQLARRLEFPSTPRVPKAISACLILV